METRKKKKRNKNKKKKDLLDAGESLSFLTHLRTHCILHTYIHARTQTDGQTDRQTKQTKTYRKGNMAKDAANVRGASWSRARAVPAAGLKNVKRNQEPAMWNLLGWSRENDDLPGQKSEKASAVQKSEPAQTWSSESASSFVYFVPANQAKPSLIASAEAASAREEKQTRKKTEEKKAETAHSATDDAENSVATAVEESSTTGGETKTKEKSNGDASRSKSRGETKAGAQKKEKIKTKSNTNTNTKAKKKKKTKKKTKKFKHIGPRPPFYNYGCANSQKPYIHSYRTYSTLPADPHEIYPSAIRAAAKRPKASAHHMAKFEFMRKQRKEAGKALEDIQRARRRAAKKPGIPKVKDIESSANDASGPPSVPRMLRLISNPPPENEGLDFFAIMSWPDAEHEEELKQRAEETRKARAAAAAEAAAEAAAIAEMIPRAPAVEQEALEAAPSAAFKLFEPESIDEVDPKKYAGLPAKMTKIIPPAGSSSIALSGEKGKIEGVADLLR